MRSRLVASVPALLHTAACASAPGATSAPTTAAPTPIAAPRPDARAELRGAIDSLVQAPEFRSANWGVLIVDLDRGDTLYSRNAGKLFMPASNQKLLTGSTALALLGPDYRFRTIIGATSGARIAAGVLRGDLVLVGRGDPSVSDHMRGDAMRPLLDAADSLAAHGIKRVTGRLVATSALRGPALGFGWAWDDLDYPYSAGVSGLLFNEGFTRAVVRGGARDGDRPSAYLIPSRRVAPLRVTATTGPRPTGVSAEDALVPTADATSAVPNAVTIGGVIAPNDSVIVEVAHRDPTAAYAAAMVDALAQRGITVSGGWTTDTMPPAALDTLLVMTSPPLREILPAMEKPSQNQIAEVLFRTLGLERTGVGSADSGRRVVERQLASWGAAPDGFAVRDGSGLSRHDYVSPETIVKLLAGVRRDSAFRVFYDALPIAGVDGTIGGRMKGTPAQGNVHAKTGFVDKARSLSGYVTTADGHVLAFSMLANNWTTPTKAVERVQDAIAARLAALRLDAR